jgi:biotin transport system substrate-specific component
MQTLVPVRISTQERLFGLTPVRYGRLIAAFSASALMGVAAHISLPLFFTPVPLTVQTLGAVLVGLALGPSVAFQAMVLYLVEGALGLPVFSPSGAGGLAQLFGVTGGYLLSYPFAAAVAGWVVRAPGARRAAFPAALAAGSLAVALTLLTGATWIVLASHATWRSVGTIAVLPFVPGEVIKVIAAAGIYSSLRRYIRF